MTPARSRRGAWVAAAGALVVLGAAGAAVVGFGGDSEGTANASTTPPATTKVTRQTLLDVQTNSGELAYGTSHTVSGKVNGTVTWLAEAGSTVPRGKPLVKIDNDPVVLLYGPMPAYRTLSSGTSGADVEQFEQNLKKLGYDGFTVDRDYTSATADAVREWQDDLGVEETGRVETNRIVFAPGAVRVDAQSAAVGDTAQPGTPLLTYTGTARVVTVSLKVDDQRLARKGAAVSIKLPDGKRTTGRITTSESVIEKSTSNGQETSDTRIDVTIRTDDAKAVAAYDRASVDVDFTASQRANVLTVPISALLALAEGGYGVQLVDGGATRIVGVRTGLFAAGRVEVTGADIAEGAQVGVPS